MALFLSSLENEKRQNTDSKIFVKTQFLIIVNVLIIVFPISGPVNISTTAVLVSPGLSVKGTMSITASEVYFEVDEDAPEYKKVDAQVGHCFLIPIKVLTRFRKKCSISDENTTFGGS